jgi:hypothetical protein
VKFNQWKKNKYGKDLRAVELADGRTCLDETAEKTQNDKEKEEDLKYNPDGNRIFKDSSQTDQRSCNRRYRLGTLKVSKKD